MQFSEEPFQQKYIFRGISASGILVNETLYTESLIITADDILIYWPVETIEDITIHSLEPILKSKPDVILIGTGEYALPLPPALLVHCFNHNAGVETMKTASAIRTYNLLANEGRKIAIGLIYRPHSL